MARPSVDTLATSAAVTVENVSRRFSIRHEKTLKGLVVSVVRGSPASETFLALDDVSFEIAPGSTVGLIGHNGSGKSTLLKIIGGVLPPSEGKVTRRGRLAALLELGAGFHGDLSGRENIYLNAEILGLSRTEVDRSFDQIVEFSGVEQFIDTPMKFYSSGMFVRLGFSVAIHTRPDVLLVDEVLAVGDEQFKKKCLDAIRGMQADGKTIILVTHNLDQVVEFCDHATLLHQGRIKAQGHPVEVIAAYRAIDARAGSLIGSRTPAAEPAIPAAQAFSVPSVRDVRASTDSGRPLKDLRSGDSLEVVVDFAGAGDTPYLGRLEVFSGSALVFGASTDRLGLPPLHGDARCRFRLPDLPLGGGRYRVAVSTVDATDGRALHRLPAAAQFSMSVLDRSSGLVAIHADAEFVGDPA